MKKNNKIDIKNQSQIVGASVIEYLEKKTNSCDNGLSKSQNLSLVGFLQQDN